MVERKNGCAERQKLMKSGEQTKERNMKEIKNN